MSLTVARAQSSSVCTNLSLLPYGILSVDITSVRTDGKRPAMTFGGSVASRTKVNVDAIRYDFARKQAFIQISSAKNEAGAKGKVDGYSRDVELDISTKRARATGEEWTLHLVNPSGKILDSQVVDFRGC